MMMSIWHFIAFHLYMITTFVKGGTISLTSQIPSVKSFLPSASDESFHVSSRVRIIVDKIHANVGSPSIYEFAKIFRGDLIEISSFAHIPDVTIGNFANGTRQNPVIFLTLGATSNRTFFNGKTTGEGYDFHVSEGLYVIKGVQGIGLWWGTRTLLQQVIMNMAASALQVPSETQMVEIPAGKGSDAPGWEIRGFMLDAGRHWFDTSFLADLCAYASFFKLNEFHIHASDNLWNPAFLYGDGNEGWKHLYAGFRFAPSPGSSIERLVPMKNESWTKEQFVALQSNCAARGITIIPEIDTPGHSLAISQWKPQLIISGEPDHLNLTYPDTIPTIKSIWSEFLPWFTALEVSIGADEYDSTLANDYISFVNEMEEYIREKAGTGIRTWGTDEPSDTLAVSTNVTIQHWDFPGDDIPVQLMREGYSVINSEQYFLYLDGKTSDGGHFPQELNQTLMWSGAPGGKGWAPNVFSPNDASNNTSIDNQRLRGSIFALWNDWGNNATTQLEIYYQLARSMAVFAEKTWAGSEVRDTALTRAQFDQLYPTLNAAAPGQNLNRVVLPKNGDIVYTYDLSQRQSSLNTSVESVGLPYTLTFSVKPDAHAPNTGVLFSGLDSKLHVRNLTFEAAEQLYALNYTLPLDRYTTLAIHATREYTYVVVDGDVNHKIWWTTKMDIWGEYMAVGNMSFAAPAKEIGGNGYRGRFGKVELELRSWHISRLCVPVEAFSSCFIDASSQECAWRKETADSLHIDC